jgi:outer membrane protein OmpA-like peptidoglycan-associated protein
VTVTFEPSDIPANGDEPAAEFDALRRLLIGPEQSRIEELSDELRSRELTSEELADRLPEAIALSSSRDEQLGRALGPTIDTALREAIRRDPQEMATAIFPVLGPAIRKAIAETMASLVRSINSAVEQSLSLNGMKWRIEAWRTGVPYPEIVIKHALVYRIEQAFLVHAESGILLEHVTATDLVVPDADLMSSMLAAIQDFVRDSFHPGEGATLRTFSVGDSTVQVEAGPRALLAIVIRGQAPDTVLLRQQDTLETLHLEFAGPLADFSGDVTPFVSARPLLESCLETVLSTTSKKQGTKIWLKWAVPLALVLVALSALWIRSSVRWNRGLAALRAEPGIMVVDASRGWNGWNISGLRDPSAREPHAILTAAGITSPSLSGKWESYLSLDPTIVATRARHAADSLRRTIEGERILFGAGSAELDQSALARLTSVAVQYRQLEQSAAEMKSIVRVELQGRTDPTGADATNATLAGNRVAAVAGWLESSGISGARLARNAIATARPLASPDSDEQARINRSVSFKVTVLPVVSSTPGRQR